MDLPTEFRAELAELYHDLEAEVARRGPVCQLSGRCCRFKEYGHVLFVSAPEIEVLLNEAPPPVRALDQGERCPWQDRQGRCTAREARPLGCRIYYCDPDYESELPEFGEAFLGRLKRLVEKHGLDWGYRPLHAHLRAARDEGRFPT
jgi:hypothetical protein